MVWRLFRIGFGLAVLTVAILVSLHFKRAHPVEFVPGSSATWLGVTEGTNSFVDGSFIAKLFGLPDDRDTVIVGTGYFSGRKSELFISQKLRESTFYGAEIAKRSMFVDRPIANLELSEGLLNSALFHTDATAFVEVG